MRCSLPKVLMYFCFIKGPPEVLDDHLDRYVAQEGDTVKLLCPIVGSPKPIVEWYQDDHLVTAAWHRYRANRKHLRIKPVTLSDSGLFVCKAVNGFGSLSVKIQLVVHGKILVDLFTCQFQFKKRELPPFHEKRGCLRSIKKELPLKRKKNVLFNEICRP